MFRKSSSSQSKPAPLHDTSKLKISRSFQVIRTLRSFRLSLSFSFMFKWAQNQNMCMDPRSPLEHAPLLLAMLQLLSCQLDRMRRFWHFISVIPASIMTVMAWGLGVNFFIYWALLDIFRIAILQTQHQVMNTTETQNYELGGKSTWNSWDTFIQTGS